MHLARERTCRGKASTAATRPALRMCGTPAAPAPVGVPAVVAAPAAVAAVAAAPDGREKPSTGDRHSRRALRGSSRLHSGPGTLEGVI